MTIPRLRRDDPLEVIDHLVTKVGTRRATSLGEADAAAFVDSRLRLAGLQVNADSFSAATSLGLTYPLLALLGITAAALSLWMVLPAFLLAIYGLILSVSDALSAPLPAVAAHRDSQNIVATRARLTTDEPGASQPRWRVVLLAPLDANGDRIGNYQIAGRQTVWLIGRIVAFMLLALLLALLLLDPHELWHYGLLIPAGYLLFSLWPRRMPIHAASLLGSAGALAVMLAVVERLTPLRSVELWTVALGATATGNSGLHDLLARYPFPKDDTLFVCLQSIAGGRLMYATREGLLGQYTADPLLAELLGATTADDERLALPPRRYLSAASIAAMLHSRGYRAVTLFTHSVGQRPQPVVNDAILEEAFPGTLLEQATGLVVDVVQRLDREV